MHAEASAVESEVPARLLCPVLMLGYLLGKTEKFPELGQACMPKDRWRRRTECLRCGNLNS